MPHAHARNSTLLGAILLTLAVIACGGAPELTPADSGDTRPAQTVGALCAVAHSASPRCTVSCGDGNACFTEVTCGPEADGGSVCSLGSGAGDQRCHRLCEENDDCGTSESCFSVQFFGCGDFNGGAEGRSICCDSEAGCGP